MASSWRGRIDYHPYGPAVPLYGERVIERVHW